MCSTYEGRRWLKQQTGHVISRAPPPSSVLISNYRRRSISRIQFCSIAKRKKIGNRFHESIWIHGSQEQQRVEAEAQQQTIDGESASDADGVVYVQVGVAFRDHTCWERPKDMDMPRMVYKLNQRNPGSDGAILVSDGMRRLLEGREQKATSAVDGEECDNNWVCEFGVRDLPYACARL